MRKIITFCLIAIFFVTISTPAQATAYYYGDKQDAVMNEFVPSQTR